jgi:CheY-like chemotaxis protein/HPt (histidine-containing phosphotransfer) domain-containing protein
MGMDEMILRENPEGVPKPYFMSVVGYAYDIMAASETLLNQINDILDISKIESGKMNLVEQEYSIAELIHNIVTMIKVRCKQKNLEFDLDIDEKLPRKLYGDQGKIKQIVLNLLTNAVKYTESGGIKLTVEVLKKKDDMCELQFIVKDTGIGVKPEDMNKLFTAFDRLDEVKNSGIQGTGLGLHISKQFADLMGGSLWCDSSYGNGSDFTFEVQQQIIEDGPIGAYEELDTNPQIRGPYIPMFTAPEVKVLVVDDNEMNLKVIEGLLRVTQIQVTTAVSGKECLEILKCMKFDLVILDHMMPGLDGVETLKLIREAGYKMPVLALTANYYADAEEVYKSYGFDGYVPKPVDGRALEEVIREHVPGDKIIELKNEFFVGENQEDLPDDMKWIRDLECIDVDEGIKNSGGAIPLVYALKLFYDTIEDHSRVLEKAFEDKDYKLYTIKVHALKSSARIVGATRLSKMAAYMENAGKSGDHDYIVKNHDALINEYNAYLLLLATFDDIDFDGDIPAISGEISAIDLKESYEAIGRFAEEMDYDAIDAIIRKLSEYDMPEEDQKIIAGIEKALRLFDWKKIEKLLK